MSNDDMSQPATRGELAESNARIDKLEVGMTAMGEDIAGIREDSAYMRGCVDGVCSDVSTMKDAIVKAATTGSDLKTKEFGKTVRWLLVVVAIGCMVLAGINSFSASKGDTSVSAGVQDK